MVCYMDSLQKKDIQKPRLTSERFFLKAPTNKIWPMAGINVLYSDLYSVMGGRLIWFEWNSNDRKAEPFVLSVLTY